MNSRADADSEREIAIRFEQVSKVVCDQYDLARSYAFRDMVRGSRPESLRSDERFAVRDLDLEIERETSVAILETPGSGGTALGHLACGMTQPSFGTVGISGRARLVSSAPTGRTPYMTVGEYLRLTGALFSNDVEEIRSGIEAARTACGLDGQEKTKLFNLPAALLRRVTLHLALYMEADVFVCAPPLKLRDPDDQALFTERVDTLLRERTFVTVAPRAVDLPAHLDRVIVLHEGRLFYDGDRETAVRIHAELLQRAELESADELFDDREEWIADVEDEMESESGEDRVRLEFDPRRIVVEDWKPLADRDTPIFVGPFLGDSGLEGAHWGPLIRAAAQELAIDPGRLIALSRGGAELWYDGVCDRYLDGYDLYDVDEFDEKCRQRIERVGLKQREPSPFEEEFVRKAAARLEIDDYEVFEVRLLMKLIRTVRNHVVKGERFLEYTRSHRSEAPRSSLSLPFELPERYVAVRFDLFEPLFPDTMLTRHFVRELFVALAERDLPVVPVHTGRSLNDLFVECPWLQDEPSVAAPLERNATHATPRENLAFQSAIVQGASAMVGSWGGTSFLAAAYGVPAVQLYVDLVGNIGIHLEAARQWFRDRKTPHRVIRITETDPQDLAGWLAEHRTP
ncbi:MAG: hypothetical protein AAF488_09535 [Planctomycetota bacterium]